ncbi:hypothetical protein F4779DRAFT_596477 [Xylariaceae sp. FL0662B]|nr:hypothetical protein F4779DRAFT_596477 [Xylariaceae sp. FL0662B]
MAKMTMTMMIGYPIDAKFNMDYYLQHHAPAAANVWKPFGAGPWRATAAADTSSPYILLIECDWPDMKTFKKAQAAVPAKVNEWFLDDMKNFTDKDPVVWFMDVKSGGS